MRINLFGGPGTGKSTVAAWLFAELKVRGYSVEYVQEYVKRWAYQKREVKPFDQVYLLAKQQDAEYGFLSAGVDHIITDSPCFNSVIYAPNPDLEAPIAELCRLYDASFPALNIFLLRGSHAYVQEGRYHNETQARQFDELILVKLYRQYGNTFYLLNVSDREKILDTVLTEGVGAAQ